jgi:hypothetical protein
MWCGIPLVYKAPHSATVTRDPDLRSNPVQGGGGGGGAIGIRAQSETPHPRGSQLRGCSDSGCSCACTCTWHDMASRSLVVQLVD